MKALVDSLGVCVVLALVACWGGRARAQEAIVSWGNENNASGDPGARTKGELSPKDRLEIEVVKGVQGLKVGIGRVGASELARIWGPDETSEGTTLSYTMSISTRVGLAVSQGSGAFQRPKIENSKERTILSYGSGVVLRVRVIRPGMQADRASNGPTPNPDDDKPAPPRWEVVTEKDGKVSILTKELLQSPGTITVQPVKGYFPRWVNIGLRYQGQDHPNNPTMIRSATDKPLVFKISSSSSNLPGSIRISAVNNYEKPEKPTIESFKGYDKLTMDDGTIFLVKLSKSP